MNPDSQDKQSADPSRGAEHRAAQRVDMQREVLFSDYSATGPLRSGTVADMSATGLRIITRYPQPVGTELQIELLPDPEKPAGVALFRGRVAHVTSLEGDESAMGVKLLRSGMTSASVVRRASDLGLVPKEESEDAPRSRPGPAGGPAPMSTNSVPSNIESTRAVRSSRAPGSRSPGSWFIMLAAALLAALLLLGAIGENESRLARGGPGGKFVYAWARDSEVRQPLQVSRSAFYRSGSTEKDRLEPTELHYAIDPGALLSRAQAALGLGEDDTAAELFKRLQAQSRADPVHRFLSLLGQAESAAARGDRGIALIILRNAQRLTSEIPAPWVDSAQSLMAQLRDPAVARPFLSPMTDLIEVLQASAGAMNDAPFRIEVDTSDYVLSVFRGDQLLKTFPVGLGRDGATPSGAFQISNKISDPKWFNRGTVVPAGTPENPLGASWMGLGDGISATSYGIHPTDNAASIGNASSRGCVRMRPDDARTLFRLVPMGTPVRIHP